MPRTISACIEEAMRDWCEKKRNSKRVRNNIGLMIINEQPDGRYLIRHKFNHEDGSEKALMSGQEGDKEKYGEHTFESPNEYLDWYCDVYKIKQDVYFPIIVTWPAELYVPISDLITIRTKFGEIETMEVRRYEKWYKGKGKCDNE